MKIILIYFFTLLLISRGFIPFYLTEIYSKFTAEYRYFKGKCLIAPSDQSLDRRELKGYRKTASLASIFMERGVHLPPTEGNKTPCVSQ